MILGNLPATYTKLKYKAPAKPLDDFVAENLITFWINQDVPYPYGNSSVSDPDPKYPFHFRLPDPAL